MANVIRGHHSMTVTHRTPVLRFEECLTSGGTHKFEVSADELPELEFHPSATEGIKIPCSQILRKTGGTWATIIKELAEHDATCLYKRIGPTTYEVTCIIPRSRVDQVGGR